MEYKLVLAVVVILVCFQESYGIKCYTCTGCNDPFDSSGVTQTDCPSDYSCQKSKAEASGAQAVTRSCAAAKQNDGCNTVDIVGVSTNVCYCNTELCNTAVTSKMSITFMFAVGVGILLFNKIL